MLEFKHACQDEKLYLGTATTWRKRGTRFLDDCSTGLFLFSLLKLAAAAAGFPLAADFEPTPGCLKAAAALCGR